MRLALLLLVSLLATTARVDAQLSADTVRESFARIKPGTLVRVHVLHDGREVGAFGGLEAEAARVGGRAIPFAAIDTIWRRSHATKTGLIVGGVTGAVLGAIAFTTLIDALCETGDCVEPKVVVFGAALGALPFGAVGAGIGRLIPKWKRIEPR